MEDVSNIPLIMWNSLLKRRLFSNAIAIILKMNWMLVMMAIKDRNIHSTELDLNMIVTKA